MNFCMRQVIKKVLWIGLLSLGPQAAWAFSLIGPDNQYTGGTGALPANFGDSWQIQELGYNPIGLVNGGITPLNVLYPLAIGPKNLGEEYRRNTPVLYYAANANFLDYFGSNGVVAIDQAFAILNALTNVDSYSPGLTEFALNTEQVNYQAQALLLTDLKSETLAMMTEQLGLADAIRYVWNVRIRYQPAGTVCAANPPGGAGGTEYAVVMRNFDITASPLNQLQYSAYVNGELYDYVIVENCHNPLSQQSCDAIEIPTDPLFNNPPVSSGMSVDSLAEEELYPGIYYTGLTRDDVAGLRYLMSTNNLDTEDSAAGSQLWVTNLSSPQLITTTNLGLFLQQAQTLDPNTLLAAYPGLIITATVTNFAFAVATNITSFYTNQPGPANTNFATLQLLTNNDLALFSSLIVTDAPAVIQALYPNLEILSSQIVGFTNIVTTNYITVLTNWIGGPAGSSRQVTMINPNNPYSVNFLPVYSYTFGNILTNTFSLITIVTNQTISVTNLIGAPAGSPLATNITTTRVTLTNTVSGDFFIIPTNWCGFTILATQWLQVIPSFTNTVAATGTTNQFGAAQSTQNTIFYYTNRIYAVFPGICEPTLAFATNVIGNIITNYVETFGNVVTNSYFTNSLFTFLTTNVFLPPLTPTNTPLVTNITTVTVVSNVPSGDFWIVPAAWNCGYTILSVPFTNIVGSTNTILTATIPPGVANIGEQYSVTEISEYTNHSLLIQPIICLTQTNGPGLYRGIGQIQFVRANYDSLLGQLFQPITNIYSMVIVTNSSTMGNTTNGVEFFRRVVTTPDFLMSASDLANPPDSTITSVANARNISFDLTTIYSGLAGPGVINPPTTFTFNKVGPVYENSEPDPMNGPNPNYLDWMWGSFDGTTNAPVVYPNGTSIQNLVSQILIQIYSTPSTLPDATNGFPYSASFSATGGEAPYTWSLGAGTQLPQSLTLSPNGVISGNVTTNTPGVYVFTLQLNDSANRVESLNYFITVH